MATGMEMAMNAMFKAMGLDKDKVQEQLIGFGQMADALQKAINNIQEKQLEIDGKLDIIISDLGIRGLLPNHSEKESQK